MGARERFEFILDHKFKQRSPRKGVKKVLKDLLLTTVKDIVYLFWQNRGQADLKHKVWLVARTTNDYKTLEFIKKDLDNAIWVVPEPNIMRPPFSRGDIFLTFRFRLFYYFEWLYYLLVVLMKNEIFYWKYSQLIFKTVGRFQESKRVIKKYRPTAIILANDHSINQRAILLAAKQLKVTNIYVQHASISTKFPPLDFDLSLLYGKDTLDKYKEIGPIKGRVELVGMPRFQDYLDSYNKNTTVTSVAICYNILDDLDNIAALSDEINKHFPHIDIYIRPHPADIRTLNVANKPYILSNSRVESAFDFLKKVDLVIAGNSSIHLEAVMFNIIAVYYEFGSSANFDYYGFYKNDLVDYADSKNAAIELIRKYNKNKINVVKRAYHYNEALRGGFNSKKRALRAIQEQFL